MKTACREPGCPEIVEDRRCPDHRSRDDRRPTSSKRGYDGVWRRTRDAYLSVHAVCEDSYDRHGGFPPDAVEVDHITPLPEGDRLDWSNLQALCRGCHERKKRRER